MPRSLTPRSAVLAAVVAIVVGGVGITPAADGAGRYANPQLLVETEEVARTLAAPDVRIVDLRSGMTGRVGYRVGHVPGAVYLDADELDDPAANAEGLPVRPAAAAAMFGRLGIDHATTVVAYDDARGLYAARLLFVLEYYGHERVRVLNGGLAKWRGEGRALESAAPAVVPRRFEPRPRRELVATAAEVQASLGKPEACLIDARSPGEFAGKDSSTARGGHIPGATNVEWTSTLNSDGTFKDADALRALFQAAGLRPDRTAVVYCTGGLRSSQSYLALRLLGAPVRNYDGSWMEWANTPTLPIER
ncbi:MAG TPA: sulfurtransferase [Methylomirabilota bacterium]|jgi:thiosulfate/3-mercaptopyruvate sulfurtransferase|nr:sulfurtransferase [Methylomirabilota bacterium]